jgi:hypothetical protein
MRVQLESPFRGETETEAMEFEQYALKALAHSLSIGEAPFASHLLYTRVLDDRDAQQRRQGIEAGLLWGEAAEATVVYQDYGISEGMEQGIERARAANRPIQYRRIGRLGEPAPIPKPQT